MNSNTLVKKILILAANPKGTSRLRLDEEVREIKSGLQRSQKRDQFFIELSSAVRSIDFRRAMLDVEPEIVHFSGHGEEDGGLAFEDEKGQVKFVDAEGLAGLFKLFKQVECVVLNACYSEIQAKAIARHVNYVIGMSQEIGDRAAIAFSVAFYDALGAGRSVEFAYELGCAAIRLENIPENLTPKLLTKKQLRTEHSNTTESKVDYTRLRDLLAAEKWKQADKETAELILKVANREEEGWLRNEDIENFSCQDLSSIDALWVKYSNGHFGFSVQQRIWQEVGGRVDKATECLLSDRVGWRVKSKWLPYDYDWLGYSELTFSLDAPQGHLPARLAGIAPIKLESFWGVASGQGAVPLCLRHDFSLPSGWVWCWSGVFFFSRVETYKL
ncbi:MAG: GUN4 domain-containing protein [Tolypothrix sp. Co-bin9]|nr:GUN4 domain-containing protein [Tolypothrix sp. Co-bin9]